LSRPHRTPGFFAPGLLLTDDAAWAWFELPTVSYDFLSAGEREALLLGHALALAGLSGAECHLVIVPEAYEVSDWAAELDATTAAPASGWPHYLAALSEHVSSGAFRRRRVFLGVLLGHRTVHRRDRRTAETAGEPHDLARWNARVDPLWRGLASSALQAVRADAPTLRWLVRRAFWRGIAGPAPDGQDAPADLASSALRNGRRSVFLEQPTGAAHVAFLAAARFPDLMTHPGAEWLYHGDVLGFPVEGSVRFRLVPPHRASADAARKLAEASDQARHIAATSAELPLALLDTTQRARELEYAVTKEGVPLVYGWPRFAVTADTPEELDGRVRELTEAYRDLGIELVRPAGDQLSLFLETLPGDRVRVGAYEQRQALITLCGGMFTATTELGDAVGPYLGETTGRSRAPVFFDPLAAAQRNLPTAIAISGQPGAGKTHLAQLLLYQLSLRGGWGLIIDPKDEAAGLAGLPGLDDVNVVRIGADHAGMLDPYAVAEDAAHGALLAADILRMLIPGELNAEQEAVLLEACRKESSAKHPCLAGVVARLRRAGPLAAQLAATLASVSQLPLANTCFGVAGQTPLVAAGRLTVLQMQGLNVPDAGTPTADYTLSDRLSVAVMYLVAVFAGRLADSSRAQAKAIVIDEAWALTASRQGRALIQRLARTGRSKNTAVVLVSQNAADFLGPEVQNNFSARFAFRSTAEQELHAVCRLLGIEQTGEHLQTLRTLRNGECVFADADGRVGTVQVELVLPELAAAFDTTPVAPPRTQAPPVPVGA
jgi:hypothetical protein